MFRYSLRLTFLVTALAAAFAAIGPYYLDWQIAGLPPPRLLEKLDGRFDSIDPVMTKGEAIDALGLRRHREHILKYGADSGSSGQLHTDVNLGDGYRLYFIESMYDGSITVRLKTSKTNQWREVRIQESR